MVDISLSAGSELKTKATHQAHAGHVLKAQLAWLLMRKSSFVSFVPFISSRIQTGVIRARTTSGFVFLALILWLGLRTFARRDGLDRR